MVDPQQSLIADPALDALGQPSPEVGTPSTATARPPRVASLIPNVDDGPRLDDAARRTATTTPDQAARVLRMQAKTGLPTEVIQRNLDQLEQQTAGDHFDVEHFRATSPLLAQWVAEHDARLPLVRDDLRPLAAIERAIGVGRNLVGAAGAGVMAFSQGAWGAIQAGADLAGADGLGTFAAGTANVARDLATTARGPQTGAGFVEHAIYSGIESAAQMAPALVAGTVAVPAALLGVNAASFGGQGYSQARDQGASVGKASVYGGLTGAIAVATEFIPAKLLLGDLAAKTPLVATLAHQIVPSLVGGEVQTALQDLNAWALLPENKDRTVRDYLAERPSAAASTAISILTAVGLQTGLAHGAAKVLDSIGAAARASSTIGRAPEQVRGLVDQLTADGPLATVHLPFDTFTEYFQSKELNPADVASQLTGDPAAYAKARQTGEDLAIPMGAYVTALAATEHGQFFSQEARLQPDALNVREARALDAQLAAQLAEATTSERPAESSTVGQIRDAVQGQLEQAGVDPSVATHYSAAYEHFFQTVGARAGVDPVALFNRIGLTIDRPTEALQPAAGETSFDQQPRPEFVAVGDEAAENADRAATLAAGKQTIDDLAQSGEADRAKATLRDMRRPGSVRARFEAATETTPARVLFQDPADPLGRILVGPDQTMRIELLKGANLSTFLHESGHLFLEVLHDVQTQFDPATLTDSQRQLQADYATLLKRFGVSSRAELVDEHGRIKTAYHESFARDFEAYLMEGKAPSVELRPVFARFRAWLVSVYRSVRTLKVELTPEVRAVMDRLLATDVAIAAAEREQHVGPAFTESAADALGLSAADRAAYRATVQAATDHARDTLQAQLLGELQRERAAWWQTERAGVRAEVVQAVAADPVYKALALLQHGTQPDGTPLPEGTASIKLSRAALVEQFGQDVLARLPKPVVYAKDGLAPSVAADLLGFSSSQALVDAIARAPRFEVAVDRAADEEMRRRHGDLLLDGTVAEQARRAVLASGADVFAAELKALAAAATRRPGGRPVTAPPLATIRELATRRIDETPVRELQPAAFAAAARRAGEAALTAAGRQDFAAAFDAKQKQVLSAELYRAAIAGRAAVDDFLATSKEIRRSDVKLAETRNLDLVYAARAVLAEFGMGRADRRVESYLTKVKAYDPESYAELSALVDAAPRGAGDYTRLPLADFRGMAEAVEALWELARTTEQMEVNGERRQLADVRREVLGQVDAFSSRRSAAGMTRAVSGWERAKEGALGLRAKLRRVEDWVTVVDNGRDGPARRALYDPVNAGAIRYDSARTRVAEAYAAIVKGLDGHVTTHDLAAPELGYTFKGTPELLGALLHTGNGFEAGSNGDKLLRGRQWGTVDEIGRVDPSRWRAFVDRLQREGVLTKAHYDYVQAVWDLNESLKPDAQRTHKARFGRYFDEVTKVGFETPFGSYAGGYFPAIADPFITPLQADRAEANALLEGGAGGSTMFPHVNRGFTQTRNPNYARPLLLDASLVLAHVNTVLRFTHLSQPVHDVARLILHPAFRGPMDAVDRGVVSDLLKPYLDRAATQQMFIPAQGRAGRAMDTIAREIRTRGAQQIVGLSATVLAEQLTHFPSVLVHPDVDATKLLAGLWRLARNPRSLARDVHENSAYMTTRESAGLVEARAAIDRILLDPNPAQRVVTYLRDHTTVLMRGIQSAMDLATWHAVYSKVAELPGVTHDQAVQRADSAIRQALGSYRPQDRSASEGGSQTAGLLNQFAGFYNTKLNMLGTEAVLASRLGLRRGASRAFAVYAAGFAIPALLGEVIKTAIAGKPITGGPDDDDAAWAFLHFVGVSQLKMAARMVPFGGAATDVALRAFAGAPSGHILNTPAITAVEHALHGPGEAYQALSNPEGRTPAQKARAVTDFFTLLGLLTDLPLRPVGQALNTATDFVSEP